MRGQIRVNKEGELLDKKYGDLLVQRKQRRTRRGRDYKLDLKMQVYELKKQIHKSMQQASFLFMCWRTNIVLAEYKSSTSLGYKKKNTHCKNIKSGLTSRKARRMSLLSTSEEKIGTEEETGRRSRCQRELKGLGLGQVIGIRKQSSFWL